MSETDFLKLKKHDNVETNTEKFDIENYLNGNWDKINENAKKTNKQILELETEKAELEKELKEGTIVEGRVKSIQPYGTFIELENGIVGLLHIEDTSVARIKTPAERFKIGQNIKVVVKSIDREQNRVFFSYKELLGTWEENASLFEKGTRVTGIAREVEKNHNGIFVELKPNLVGMAEYKENIEYGQNVEVYIKNIIPEKKKIKLIIV